MRVSKDRAGSARALGAARPYGPVKGSHGTASRDRSDRPRTSDHRRIHVQTPPARRSCTDEAVQTSRPRDHGLRSDVQKCRSGPIGDYRRGLQQAEDQQRKLGTTSPTRKPSPPKISISQAQSLDIRLAGDGLPSDSGPNPTSPIADPLSPSRPSPVIELRPLLGSDTVAGHASPRRFQHVLGPAHHRVHRSHSPTRVEDCKIERSPRPIRCVEHGAKRTRTDSTTRWASPSGASASPTNSCWMPLLPYRPGRGRCSAALRSMWRKRSS